jgi:MFS family permease
MKHKLIPIAALLGAFFILCLGHGLQSVLVPARATLDAYSSGMTGIMMSAYFGGFMAGTAFGARLISRVGHTRVFAAVASVAAITMLGLSLSAQPALWMLLRFVYGLSMAHIFMVIESWLNAMSDKESRGRILSIYMMVNFGGVICGQWMMGLADPAGFALFSLAAIFMCMALPPLLLSVASPPSHHGPLERFGLRDMYHASPLGTVGMILTGIMSGAFWGLGVVFAMKLGFTAEQASMFVSVSYIGGLSAQVPLGWLSDRIGRRIVIAAAAGTVCVASTGLCMLALSDEPLSWHIFMLGLGLLFGMGFHPLYSLLVAHVNDFLPPQHFVKAAAGLLALYSFGAIAGPLFAGQMMGWWGAQMLFVLCGLSMSALLLLCLWRIIISRPVPQDTADRFIPTAVTGMLAFEMDPRGEPKEPPPTGEEGA